MYVKMPSVRVAPKEDSGVGELPSTTQRTPQCGCYDCGYGHERIAGTSNMDTRLNEETSRHPGALPVWLPWLAVFLALLAMYMPSFRALGDTFWGNADDAEGVIILAISIWLAWRERRLFLQEPNSAFRPLGALSLFLGLLLYALGRSQEFFQFEVGSLIPVLLGTVALLLGRGGLRRLWFPILFLVFLVPIPGSVLDSVLLPLKQVVSWVVDEVLYSFGYPISRNGVVLVIGGYQLLIADACSGLNSMVALSGIGLLYVYLVGSDDKVTMAALLLSVVPVAFIANVLRVLVLVLVTYYFGEAAGQRFHDVAGYLEIGIAFGAFFLLDSMLVVLARRFWRIPRDLH